jgi:hypothetical protein
MNIIITITTTLVTKIVDELYFKKFTVGTSVPPVSLEPMNSMQATSLLSM